MIRTTMLEGLDEALKDHARTDVDVGDLLREAGLFPTSSKGLPPFVSLNTYATILERASSKSCESCFGLRFANVYPIGASGVLGSLLQHVPDLKTMVDCIARYVCLQIDNVEIAHYQEGGNACLELRFGPDLTVPHKQLTEFLLALFVDRVRRLVGTEWMPTLVEVRYPDPRTDPRCRDAYRRIFGPNIAFGAARDAIIVDSASLERKVLRAEPRIFAAMRGLAEEDLRAHRTSGNIITRARSMIAQQLSRGRVTLESVAVGLQCTPRKLQTSLRECGTCFENELSSVRRRMAQDLLRTTDLPMTEIAMRLGFSELSAFTRAAKAWFGKPPRAIRAALKAAPQSKVA